MRRVAITILVLAGLSAHVLSQNTPGDRAGGVAEILTADDVQAIVERGRVGARRQHVVGGGCRSHRRHPRRLRARNAGERGTRFAVLCRARGCDVLARSGAAVVTHRPLHQRHPLSCRRAEHTATPRSTASRTSTAAARSIRAGDAAVQRRRSRGTRVDRRHLRPGAGTMPLPCEPSDTRGCARGGPMLRRRRQPS